LDNAATAAIKPIILEGLPLKFKKLKLDIIKQIAQLLYWYLALDV